MRVKDSQSKAVWMPKTNCGQAWFVKLCVNWFFWVFAREGYPIVRFTGVKFALWDKAGRS